LQAQVVTHGFDGANEKGKKGICFMNFIYFMNDYRPPKNLCLEKTYISEELKIYMHLVKNKTKKLGRSE